MVYDPVDHLLMPFYKIYQWGEPAEKPSQNGNPLSTISKAKNTGLNEETYHARPTIIYTNEKGPFTTQIEMNKLPDNLFDLLGEYQVKSYNTEGTIFLYETGIHEIGLLFYKNVGRVLKMSRSYCVDLVREIVLWRGLGHWITHWMPGKDHNRWNRKSYLYDEITNEVHESLALVFVQFAILHIEDDNRRNHFQIFYHLMLQKQQKDFYMYNQILKHPRFGWNNLLGAITMLRILENPKEVKFKYLLENLNAI